MCAWGGERMAGVAKRLILSMFGGRASGLWPCGGCAARGGPGFHAGDRQGGRQGPPPSFALKDQRGQERTLESLLNADGHLALVFYRSADW